MRWAPVLFVPAPLRASALPSLAQPGRAIAPSFPFADVRLTPRHPEKSPLDDLFRLVDPAADAYVTEKYAFEIAGPLTEWSRSLRTEAPALNTIAKSLDPSVEVSALVPEEEKAVRAGGGIEVFRRRFASALVRGRERFFEEWKKYFAEVSRVETAEFEIVGIRELGGPSVAVAADIRYDLAGTRNDGRQEERIGIWRTEWSRGAAGWQVRKWQATGETLSRARGPIFADVSWQALGAAESYRSQMLHGVDHWRTVLDAACGIDVYGNNGVAAGDFDNDGFDDLYVCQPSGLPNRLYRNRGDGTFEDVTEKSGVGVLDGTACALFADFENKGLQDLLVVCGSGPLLFLNQGNGKFTLKDDAFRFSRLPEGTLTHAAVADYDRDGRLDIYFCVYSYYLGLDQYHYPAPYFDARNGPPNFLLHNEGNATFEDRTEAAGLNADNDRYSFACAWGDYDADGWPDLYVANDFGRSNLYRNNGNGTFAAVSSEAHVEDAGAGMSASWLDLDNDGKQDVYVANMWSAAGIRISEQKKFRESDPEEIRALYRQHARGNSLYRNQGNGKFTNVGRESAVDMGRWAWSSDAWDFDHDGYPDLYVANGYISGPEVPGGDRSDLASFFWRQVVGQSPEGSTSSLHYERGWNAINELIRADGTWNGFERNVFFANNRDGTFSDVSGVVGLDFPEDSRAFALADLDGDGRLEVVLKNRNAPQLRILRNVMEEIGDRIAFRLRGTKSNRDAIGAAISVEAGQLRQTKYLEAGSGFLSQHAKELFFGLGRARGPVRATIRWPSGLTQSFEPLPANHRFEMTEGSETFRATPFGGGSPAYARAGETRRSEPQSSPAETWLIEPLTAPEFSLPDLTGKLHDLRSLRGAFVLASFWSAGVSASVEQLRLFEQRHSALAASGVQIIAMNVDESGEAGAVRSLAAREALPFPVLLATPEIAGVYNIIYRYLFDRRCDLGIPTSLLIDPNGMIVKVYQGQVAPHSVMKDLQSVPKTPAERVKLALPFPGMLHRGEFQRNAFTYGVAFFQRGHLEQAEISFQQAIATTPDDPEALYNLGTLYLRRSALPSARRNLQQAVKLRPNYPEAWNNLGMIAAQEGQNDEAVRNFQQSLSLRPSYATALLNLGNLYRRLGHFSESQKLLERVLEITPDDPEVSYNLGMLYARQDQLDRASQYLERAVSLRPDYADALNNLGVLFVRQQRNSDAEEKFQACIKVAPGFDQAYLNLARLYVLLQQKEKAKEVLLALLRQQPQHKMAQQALEMLN